MSTFQILKRPIQSEKSTRMRELNQYVVEVDSRASKGDIRIVIEQRYKVDVVSVRTMNIQGKYRRRTGPVGGYQSDRKKAIVSLKEGQKLTWEEGK